MCSARIKQSLLVNDHHAQRPTVRTSACMSYTSECLPGLSGTGLCADSCAADMCTRGLREPLRRGLRGPPATENGMERGDAIAVGDIMGEFGAQNRLDGFSYLNKWVGLLAVCLYIELSVKSSNLKLADQQQYCWYRCDTCRSTANATVFEVGLRYIHAQARDNNRSQRRHFDQSAHIHTLPNHMQASCVQRGVTYCSPTGTLTYVCTIRTAGGAAGSGKGGSGGDVDFCRAAFVETFA
jgi:hypothetical protein